MLLKNNQIHTTLLIGDIIHISHELFFFIEDQRFNVIYKVKNVRLERKLQYTTSLLSHGKKRKKKQIYVVLNASNRAKALLNIRDRGTKKYSSIK